MNSAVRRIRTSWFVVLLALSFVLLFFATPTPAMADGGAPNLAYVAGGSQGIGIIDIGQQQVKSPIAIAGDPHMIYLTQDGRYLYVTQPALGQVSMLSAKTNQVLCSARGLERPVLLAYDTVDTVLYVAGTGSGHVYELDAGNCKLLRTLSVQGTVSGLAINLQENGAQLWVAGSSGLTAFTASGQQFATVSLKEAPEYITIPPGFTAYVTTQQGSIFAVDMATGRSSRLLTGGTFGPMDYDAMTGDVYAPDRQHQRVDVLAPVSGSRQRAEPVQTINTDGAPLSIAITSDGAFGFVALANGNVAMLDIPGRQMLNSFHVGGDIHFIITGLYPPTFGTAPGQTAVLDTLVHIAAYIVIFAIFLVPAFFLWRYSKKQQVKQLPS